MDRGSSFSLGYLGSSPLSQVATGLGMLQKPLRDLYIKHRKPGKGTFLPECRVSMTSNGMSMTYREAPEAPHVPPREDLYPVENIIMWDTVRFIAVKSTEKKKTVIKYAFEPLDNDHSRNKDNLFTTLDKKYFYLQDQQHPPIFTCVLRRKSGVKALDIHAFFCDSDTEALDIVKSLNFLQNSFKSNQAQETGVFGYSPFGAKSAQISSAVSGGSQRQRMQINNKDDVQPTRQSVLDLATTVGATAVAPQHNQIPRQNQRQGSTSSQHDITSPIDRASSVQYRQSSNKTHHQSYTNKSSESRSGSCSSSIRSHNPSPFNSSERGSSVSGSQRIYHLSQEDLLSPQLSVASHHSFLDNHESFPERDEDIEIDDGYQYLPHVTHSLERRQGETQRNVVDSEFVPPHFTSGSRQDISLRVTNLDDHFESQDIDQENAGPRYVSKLSLDKRSSAFSENKPFNYLGGSGSSPKKTNNTGGCNNRDDSVKNMGQGYSLLSGSNDRPQSLHPEGLNSPVTGHDSSTAHEGSGGVSVDQNRQIFKELLHLQKTQQYQARSSPSSNEASLDRQQQRPMLRPPKSPGYLDKPPGKNKTEEQESSPEDNNDSVASRTSGIVAAAQSQIIEPFKTRSISDSQQTPQQVKTKPIARVPPHKVTGVRVMPINFDSSSVPKRNASETDALSPTRGDRPKSGIFLQSPTSPDKRGGNSFDNPPKRSHSQHNITQDLSDDKSNKSQKNGNNAKQGSAANWQFGPTKNSSRESSLNAKQKQQKDLENNMDDKLGEKLLLSKKKDAEIASVMQNLRLDYREAPTLTPGAPGGMNFEKSLGYFP